MAGSKKNPITRPRPSQLTRNGPADEVLTLTEAAEFLRLTETEVVDLIHSQNLPGRFTGSQWRFLKSAIQQWLSTGVPTRQARKEAQLALAGAWKDDPDIEEIVREAYRRRGRPMTEGE